MKFAPTTYADGHAPEPGYARRRATVAIDRAYDGTAKTRPDGIIYLVTGSGGADLYDPDQTDAVSTWEPFTTKFVADIHSLTVLDITPGAATVRQVDANGKELDRFTVAR